VVGGVEKVPDAVYSTVSPSIAGVMVMDWSCRPLPPLPQDSVKEAARVRRERAQNLFVANSSNMTDLF
jgi:hypothetical protein